MATSGMSSRTRGLAGLAVIAMTIASAACSTETRYVSREGTPGADGTEGADGTGANPSAEEPTAAEAEDEASPRLAVGLAITEIAFFQAVKVPVMKAAKAVAPASRNAPVVAGRPALVRVYVARGAAYDGGSVTAELRLFDGETPLPVLQDARTVTSDSTDAELGSTFNFEVPAASLPAGVRYQVLLRARNGVAARGESANEARFPGDGSAESAGASASGKLKIVIVPVKYDADGSGRTPDVGPEQLARYTKTFMARYPASDVEVTARAPLPYASTISPNGAGFSQVLNAITNLRRADNAAPDVYYYGTFAPTASFSAFCRGGCVTGLSALVESSKTSFLRASVGVGYPGQDSINTAAHEIGHAHGRAHAPCGGPQSVDPEYPYAGGAIGAWGYDLLQKTLINPTKGRDMMGYCPNEWVSDYTFTGLFDRIAVLNGNPAATAKGSSLAAAQTFAAPQTFRMATVDADGAVAWGAEVELDEDPAEGTARLTTFLSASGETLGTSEARFYPYDHLPGGVLLVPPAPRETLLRAKARLVPTWSAVRIAGVSRILSR